MIPIRPQNPNVRNLYRNIIAQAVNAVLPGFQRNNTSRDAKALAESTDFGSVGSSTNLGNAPMFGVSQAGE